MRKDRKKGRPPPGGEEAEVVVYQPRGVGLIHPRHKPSNAHYTHGTAKTCKRHRCGLPRRSRNRRPKECVLNCHFVFPSVITAPGASMLTLVTASDRAAGELIAQQSGPHNGRPVRTAAFFDLDKTVIAKSSTLAFSKPFFNQGLINRRTVLKSAYAQFLFLMSGADHDQMDRMRSYLTNMCAGWDVEQVKSIVGETLHDIVDPLVFAEAADLIADHKICGRDVVVVSASGEEIVGPIAKARSEEHTPGL